MENNKIYADKNISTDYKTKADTFFGFGLILATSMLLATGCAKSQSNTAGSSNPNFSGNTTLNSNTTELPVPPGANFDGSGSSSPSNNLALTAYESPLDIEGSTATAEINKLRQFFSDYSVLGYDPIVNPTNVRIGMYVQKGMTVAPNYNPTWTGYVWVAFEDNGRTRRALLSTRHPYNTYVTNADYNYWFMWGSQKVFHGFFQDRKGAVVLVIDSTVDTGDGLGTTTLGGALYFQNFDNDYIQGPLKMCWEITAGPYDCRTFIVGSKMNLVDPTSALYPNNSGQNTLPYPRPAYSLLGRFSKLKKVNVFIK